MVAPLSVMAATQLGDAGAVFAGIRPLPESKYVSVTGQGVPREEWSLIVEGVRANWPPVGGLKLEGGWPGVAYQHEKMQPAASPDIGLGLHSAQHAHAACTPQAAA